MFASIVAFIDILRMINPRGLSIQLLKFLFFYLDAFKLSKLQNKLFSFRLLQKFLNPSLMGPRVLKVGDRWTEL